MGGTTCLSDDVRHPRGLPSCSGPTMGSSPPRFPHHRRRRRLFRQAQNGSLPISSQSAPFFSHTTTCCALFRYLISGPVVAEIVLAFNHIGNVFITHIRHLALPVPAEQVYQRHVAQPIFPTSTHLSSNSIYPLCASLQQLSTTSSATSPPPPLPPRGLRLQR